MVKFSHDDFEEKFYKYGKNNNYNVISKYTRMIDKITLKHKKCGYEFTRMASKTTPKVYCPKCHKQHRSKRTDKMFKEEIINLVGDEYTPLDKYINTDTKVKMKHNICGNVWGIAPNTFLNAGVRCPKCAKGGIRRGNEWFLKKLKSQEDYGIDYIFEEDYNGYDNKITVKHKRCGRSYKVTPNKFLQGRRCPLCRESRGESRIDFLLRKKGILYKREATFKGLKNKRNLKCDFYIKDKRYIPFVIEFDGEQHFIPSSSNERHLNKFKYINKLDDIKNRYMTENNIRMYRIPYWDIDEVEYIVKEILQENLQRLSKT